MFWKNLPYWLKGGLIFDLIFIVAFLFLMLPVDVGNFLFIILVPGIGIIEFFPGMRECYGFIYRSCPLSNQEGFLLLFVFSLIFYFIIGAIVALIYKKIKYKK